MSFPIPEIWQREIDAGSAFGVRAAKAIAASKYERSEPKPLPPDVSTFGTSLRQALEKETGKALSCGTCLGYLRRLNHQSEHDGIEIAQYLFANYPFPQAWRESIGDKITQRQRIIEIVESMWIMMPTGNTRRTAVWNYAEVRCLICGRIDWISAGSTFGKCGCAGHSK